MKDKVAVPRNGRMGTVVITAPANMVLWDAESLIRWYSGFIGRNLKALRGCVVPRTKRETNCLDERKEQARQLLSRIQSDMAALRAEYQKIVNITQMFLDTDMEGK